MVVTDRRSDRHDVIQNRCNLWDTHDPLQFKEAQIVAWWKWRGEFSWPLKDMHFVPTVCVTFRNLKNRGAVYTITIVTPNWNQVFGKEFSLNITKLPFGRTCDQPFPRTASSNSVLGNFAISAGSSTVICKYKLASVDAMNVLTNPSPKERSSCGWIFKGTKTSDFNDMLL